ncbi:MAG: hypothetical protein ACK53Y_02195, partial [bacterium]
GYVNWSIRDAGMKAIRQSQEFGFLISLQSFFNFQLYLEEIHCLHPIHSVSVHDFLRKIQNLFW